jgi:LmbE family N-acetylglucosaminyl deacetylase
MIKTLFESSNSQPLKVLCLGAHCDDIEIGCGGTLLRLREQARDLQLTWVVFSSDTTRSSESRAAANAILQGGCDISFHTFRDGYFPADYGALKDEFEKMKTVFCPDVVFTHYRHDHHQDHRIIAELTASTYRSHLILEYEIPKYDGDLGNPPVFVPLAKETCDEKARIITDANVSQRQKQWFSKETFMSLMRLRGIQCNSSTGYAEAFYCHKICLSLENV